MVFRAPVSIIYLLLCNKVSQNFGVYNNRQVLYHAVLRKEFESSLAGLLEDDSHTGLSFPDAQAGGRRFLTHGPRHRVISCPHSLSACSVGFPQLSDLGETQEAHSIFYA